MRFLRGIWNRKWLVAGIALVISAGFLGVAMTMIHSKWEAVVALIMRTQQDQFSLGAGQAYKPQQYNLKTLLDTLKLPSSLQEVLENTGIKVLPRTPLAGAIEVIVGKDSNIFQIKVTWDNAKAAAALANQVAAAFVERSRTIRRQDAEETFTSCGAQLDEAGRSCAPSTPNSWPSRRPTRFPTSRPRSRCSSAISSASTPSTRPSWPRRRPWRRVASGWRP